MPPWTGSRKGMKGDKWVTNPTILLHAPIIYIRNLSFEKNRSNLHFLRLPLISSRFSYEQLKRKSFTPASRPLPVAKGQTKTSSSSAEPQSILCKVSKKIELIWRIENPNLHTENIWFSKQNCYPWKIEPFFRGRKYVYNYGCPVEVQSRAMRAHTLDIHCQAVADLIQTVPEACLFLRICGKTGAWSWKTGKFESMPRRKPFRLPQKHICKLSGLRGVL